MHFLSPLKHFHVIPVYNKSWHFNTAPASPMQLLMNSAPWPCNAGPHRHFTLLCCDGVLIMVKGGRRWLWWWREVMVMVSICLLSFETRPKPPRPPPPPHPFPQQLQTRTLLYPRIRQFNANLYRIRWCVIVWACVHSIWWWRNVYILYTVDVLLHGLVYTVYGDDLTFISYIRWMCYCMHGHVYTVYGDDVTFISYIRWMCYCMGTWI